jgi:hypothetical protein
MSSDALTTNQLHVLRHALGIGEAGTGHEHRNHFVTGAGSADHVLCTGLVAAGMMLRRAGNTLSGGEDVFTVTTNGRVAAQGPRMVNLSTIEHYVLTALQAAGDAGLNLSEIGYALVDAGIVTTKRSHLNPQGAALMASPYMARLRSQDLLQRRYRGTGYEITRAGRAAVTASAVAGRTSPQTISPELIMENSPYQAGRRFIQNVRIALDAIKKHDRERESEGLSEVCSQATETYPGYCKVGAAATNTNSEPRVQREIDDQDDEDGQENG